MDERLQKYINNLSLLINVPTISDAEILDKDAFIKFRSLLKELFPLVFENFKYEEFNGAILLSYIVKGCSDSFLFMSHHDVVSENGEWVHEPFNAKIDGTKLYGRGTLDTKGNLWAILTAIEELLKEGYKFPKSIYVESSCNEETTGEGAYEISRELKNRGVRFNFTLDEGGLITYNPIGIASGNFAMVAIGEKDCVDLKFIAKSNGGHASTPDKNNPLVRLAKFIVEVEKRDIFKPKLEPVNIEMLSKLSLKMKGLLKFVFRRAGLIRHVLARLMTKFSPTANSLVRTTICFTKAKGSHEFNVIPTEAFVTGNLRISHHDSKEDVLKKLNKIAKKYDVEIVESDKGYRSDICDYKTKEFKFLEQNISESFEGVITVPYISTGASDSKYFSDLSDNVFRFAPFSVTDEQLDAMHAKDENIEISTLIPAVEFYKKLMRKL